MTRSIPQRSRAAAAAATLLGLSAWAQAAIVDVTVTVQNLAPANSISFAPLHLGFNNGSFDAFNLGTVATAPIISVAEGGAGAAWQAAFAMADPGATRGTVGGLLQPGSTSSLTLRVDTTLNPFFTFAAMAVPSNDFFIGNDSPTAYRLFDAGGNLNMPTIHIKAGQIWDAGSEVFDPAAAAFVGTNDLRRPQNSVVAFNFAELAAFNGLTTGAGYTFSSGLTADSDVYRIAFGVSPVPEPGSYALMGAGLMAMGFIARRRRSGGRQADTAIA
ncbi:MAG TPA: spondin domain-containing protein [Rubrivivax sp.]|nr:spondin domain-containing protein [Rubrivivax sp.]